MKIINLTDKRQLNNFVASQDKSQFLQSWEWGEFQSRAAGKIIRLGVINNDELAAAATLVKKALPMGKSYFLCPRGPIVKNEILPKEPAKPAIKKVSANTLTKSEIAALKKAPREPEKRQIDEVIGFLFNEIKEYDEGDVMFMRFEPQFKIDSSPEREIIETLEVQPSKTLMLDLSLPEEEILKQMHQKTRYNIKLAEKKEIKIIEAGVKRFDDFWQLMGETQERDNFRLHGIDYYKKMLETDKQSLKLYFAEIENRPIATGVFSFFGDTVSYLHGASADHDRELMAPYLLHWHIIKQAKAAGIKYYDLFGIDEEKWPGVTRFKKGFGGLEVSFPGTFDLVFDANWYGIYQMFRKVRRTF